MEINEINIIKNEIEIIKTIDLNFIQKASSADLKRLSGKETYDLLQIIIVVFSEAIEANLLFAQSKHFLKRESRGPQPGAQSFGDITSVIKQLKTHLSKNNLPAIETDALEVQNYIYQKGIISVLNRNDEQLTFEKLKILNNENKTINSNLQTLQKEAERLKFELEDSKNSFLAFQKQKEVESNRIVQNMETTNSIKKEIENTQNLINNIKQQAEKILVEITQIVNSKSNDLSGFVERYKQIEENIKLKDIEYQSIQSKISETSSSLDTLNEKAKNVEKELSKLLTPAIAENLLIAFKKRKIWLFWTKIFWLIAILTSISFLAYYAFKIFDSQLFSFEIEKVAVSAIKLAPFVIVLYFCIRQFSKDRNLEEEYAFREAIATTLMSYAEQIKDSPEKQQELIRDTVAKLYLSPTDNQIKRNEMSNAFLEKVIDPLSKIAEKAVGKQSGS